MDFVSLVRGYCYLSGVLMNQQRDPFCSKCKALANTITTARESLEKFEREYASELQGLPKEFQRRFAEGKASLAGIALPNDAAGQKKAGRCKLPEGVCFIKSALALLQRV